MDVFKPKQMDDLIRLGMDNFFDPDTELNFNLDNPEDKILSKFHAHWSLPYKDWVQRCIGELCKTFPEEIVKRQLNHIFLNNITHKLSAQHVTIWIKYLMGKFDTWIEEDALISGMTEGDIT